MTSDASGTAVAPWPLAVPPPLLRAAPALAALAYPALIWTGPAIWPPLLALAVVAPAIAVWAYVRSGGEARITRGIALAAVGMPPTFTFLGSMLDFQEAWPISGLTVWIPLWLALAVVASRSPPIAASPVTAAHRTPRALAVVHGLSALPIIAFGLAHIINQASGIAGGATHLAIMTALRTVYRHPVGELLLFGCIAAQMITGVLLIVRSRRPLDALDRLQRAAGAYLAVFFVSHITATLRARYLYDRDTNWTWLSKFKLTDAWNARLGPYYALVIFALAIHLAGAVRHVAIGRGARPERMTWVFAVAAALATIAALLTIIGLVRA